MSEPVIVMTREQRDMAVAIARDIVKQVESEKLTVVARSGYIVPWGNGWEDLCGAGGDLRDHVDTVQSSCRVCMLGAAVLSKARLFDNIPARNIFPAGSYWQYVEREVCVAALADVFDRRTLHHLEAAFECNSHMGTYGDPDDFSRGAAAFGSSYGDAESRAVAIAENIVANDGLFVVQPVSSEDFVPSRYEEEDEDLDDGDDDLDGDNEDDDTEDDE